MLTSVPRGWDQMAELFLAGRFVIKMRGQKDALSIDVVDDGREVIAGYAAVVDVIWALGGVTTVMKIHCYVKSFETNCSTAKRHI